MLTEQSAADLFEESLSLLARIAMRNTGASGFAYFRSQSGSLTRSCGGGARIPEEIVSSERSETAISFPLRFRGAVDGYVVFAFSEPEKRETAQAQLKQCAVAIEKVWAAQSLARTYHEILESIIGLEAELIDAKISNRARGVLRGAARQETFHTIARHVESVLRPSEIFRTLNQIREELQKEVEERKWTSRAKWILEHDLGMSEEEAHRYLRKVSRTSRKPFLEIARQVIEDKHERRNLSAIDLLNNLTPNPTQSVRSSKSPKTGR